MGQPPCRAPQSGGHLAAALRPRDGRHRKRSCDARLRLGSGPEELNAQPDAIRTDPDALGRQLEGLNSHGLSLDMITNRGVKVYPEGQPETFCTDHWRCRFLAPEATTTTHRQVIDLLSQIEQAGLDFIKTEQLYTINGERGYSLGLGG